MKKRIGKISISLLVFAVLLTGAWFMLSSTSLATPINTTNSLNASIGAYTGPEAGTAQDDNNKASLDLAHVDLDAILANQAGTGALIAGQTYVLSSSEASVEAAAVDLFAVGGGPIEIISCFGDCTVDCAGSPGALNLEIDATTADYDADFTTAVSVDASDKGDILQFAAITAGESVLVPTAGVNAGLPISWYCPIGMIEQATASTGTGKFVWRITFRPLTSGVTVTAQ